MHLKCEFSKQGPDLIRSRRRLSLSLVFGIHTAFATYGRHRLFYELGNMFLGFGRMFLPAATSKAMNINQLWRIASSSHALSYRRTHLFHD